MSLWTQLAQVCVDRRHNDAGDITEHRVTATIDVRALTTKMFRITLLDEVCSLNGGVETVTHTVKVVGIQHAFGNAVALAHRRFKTAAGNEALGIQALSQAHAEALDKIAAEKIKRNGL